MQAFKEIFELVFEPWLLFESVLVDMDFNVVKDCKNSENKAKEEAKA